VSRVVLLEPFAEALAAKNLCTEVEAAVSRRQLPRDRKRCVELAHYLALVECARTGAATSLGLSDLRSGLPSFGLALAAARRNAARARKRKRADHDALPDVLTALASSSSVGQQHDGGGSETAKNDDDDDAFAPVHAFFDESSAAAGVVVRRLATLGASRKFLAASSSSR